MINTDDRQYIGMAYIILMNWLINYVYIYFIILLYIISFFHLYHDSRPTLDSINISTQAYELQR